MAIDNPAVTVRVIVLDLEPIEKHSELAQDVIKDGCSTFLVHNAGRVLQVNFRAPWADP